MILTTLYLINHMPSLYSTTKYHIPFCFPNNIFIIYRVVCSDAHVLFMSLLQIKINLLQNPLCVFSLATFICNKDIDVIPHIICDTLSLPILASLRLVLCFLSLKKIPIIIVTHSSYLYRS